MSTPSDHLDQNATDYVVASVKATLGMVPFAGSLLTELAGTIVPKQRVDRLVDFARRLEKDLSELDQTAIRAQLQNENFTDLLEESARQAASAVTEDRRQYLAEMIKSGVSTDRISFIETRHLLRLLGQINDIEVIWLRYYAYPLLNGDDEFRNRHSAILEPVIATIGSGDDVLERQALQRNYVEHLVSLGLLERPLALDPATKQPVFDRNTGTWKVRSHQVTPLGRLLLRHIGLSVSMDA